MKKDFTRDYVTEAFRLYAAMGMPTYEQARADIYGAALLKNNLCDPQAAVAKAELAVAKKEPLLLDLLAVDKTINLLERGEKHYIVSAVKEIYFTSPQQPLRKGDISGRVRKFSLQCPTDERTVYRWLREARLLCDLDKNKFSIVQPLIKTAAFNAVSLAELEETINKDGFVVDYKNGENQYGTKQSDEVKTLIALQKNLTAALKALADIAPASKPKKSRLRELMGN